MPSRFKAQLSCQHFPELVRRTVGRFRRTFCAPSHIGGKARALPILLCHLGRSGCYYLHQGE